MTSWLKVFFLIVSWIRYLSSKTSFLFLASFASLIQIPFLCMILHSFDSLFKKISQLFMWLGFCFPVSLVFFLQSLTMCCVTNILCNLMLNNDLQTCLLHSFLLSSTKLTQCRGIKSRTIQYVNVGWSKHAFPLYSQLANLLSSSCKVRPKFIDCNSVEQPW